MLAEVFIKHKVYIVSASITGNILYCKYGVNIKDKNGGKYFIPFSNIKIIRMIE